MTNPDDRDYSNEIIVVHWRPERCTHCKTCVTEMPQVFNADARPWVNLAGAKSVDIACQCDRCPSGALSWSPFPPRVKPAPT